MSNYTTYHNHASEHALVNDGEAGDGAKLNATYRADIGTKVFHRTDDGWAFTLIPTDAPRFARRDDAERAFLAAHPEHHWTITDR